MQRFPLELILLTYVTSHLSILFQDTKCSCGTVRRRWWWSWHRHHVRVIHWYPVLRRRRRWWFLVRIYHCHCTCIVAKKCRKLRSLFLGAHRWLIHLTCFLCNGHRTILTDSLTRWQRFRRSFLYERKMSCRCWEEGIAAGNGRELYGGLKGTPRPLHMWILTLLALFVLLAWKVFKRAMKRHTNNLFRRQIHRIKNRKWATG